MGRANTQERRKHADKAVNRALVGVAAFALGAGSGLARLIENDFRIQTERVEAPDNLLESFYGESGFFGLGLKNESIFDELFVLGMVVAVVSAFASRSSHKKAMRV